MSKGSPAWAGIDPHHRRPMQARLWLEKAGVFASCVFLGRRLYELHRILKRTGSIYLHCDHHAIHYLKVLMDAVWGKDQFQAEIVWQRTSAHNDSHTFGNVTDSLLFYGASTINADACPNHSRRNTSRATIQGRTGGAYTEPTTSPAPD